MTMRCLKRSAPSAWALVYAYVLVVYAWWSVITVSELYAQTLAIKHGVTYYGYTSLTVFAMSVCFLDWSLACLFETMRRERTSEISSSLGILLLFPPTFAASYFASLLFSSIGFASIVLSAALYAFLSFPAHAWQIVVQHCSVFARQLFGTIGTVDARRELLEYDERQRCCVLLERDVWLVAHARFQAQKWGIGCAGLALVVDYFQPNDQWFFQGPKNVQNLIIAMIVFSLMLLTSMFFAAVVNAFASRCAVPTGILALQDRNREPHNVLPEVLNQHAFYVGSLLLSSAALSMYKVQRIQLTALSIATATVS